MMQINLNDGGDLIEVDEQLIRSMRVEQEIQAMRKSMGRASSANTVEPGVVGATDQIFAERSARTGWGAHPEGDRLRAAMEAGGLELPPLSPL